jgi:DNA-binding winged helix-turn-helix (wHTH) protein
MDEETFAFGAFRLIPAQRVLLDDGKPLRLGNRGLDILTTLVERAGETIPKEQLIARTWPDTVVDEGALRVHVAALRTALGDGRAGRRYITNNPGRGMRLSHRSSASIRPRHLLRRTEQPTATICPRRSRVSSAATMSSPRWRNSWSGAVF